MDVLELPRPVINFLRTMARENCRYVMSWDIAGSSTGVTLTLAWNVVAQGGQPAITDIVPLHGGKKKPNTLRLKREPLSSIVHKGQIATGGYGGFYDDPWVLRTDPDMRNEPECKSTSKERPRTKTDGDDSRSPANTVKRKSRKDDTAPVSLRTMRGKSLESAMPTTPDRKEDDDDDELLKREADFAAKKRNTQSLERGMTKLQAMFHDSVQKSHSFDEPAGQQGSDKRPRSARARSYYQPDDGDDGGEMSKSALGDAVSARLSEQLFDPPREFASTKKSAKTAAESLQPPQLHYRKHHVAEAIDQTFTSFGPAAVKRTLGTQTLVGVNGCPNCGSAPNSFFRSLPTQTSPTNFTRHSETQMTALDVSLLRPASPGHQLSLNSLTQTSCHSSSIYVDKSVSTQDGHCQTEHACVHSKHTQTWSTYFQPPPGPTPPQARWSQRPFSEVVTGPGWRRDKDTPLKVNRAVVTDLNDIHAEIVEREPKDTRDASCTADLTPARAWSVPKLHRDAAVNTETAFVCSLGHRVAVDQFGFEYLTFQ